MKTILSGLILILISVFNAQAAYALKLCVLPVIDSDPKLKVEIEQPYRMATDPRILPSYDGLLIHAFNRHELYEFDGTRVNLIKDPFPHVWGFAYRHGIHLSSQGQAYGFGSKPRAIFYTDNKQATWTPIEGTHGYYQAFYDIGSNTVYFRQSRLDAALPITNGKIGKQITLPVWEGKKTQSIHTVSDLGVALALTGNFNSTPNGSNSIWYRLNEKDWQKISLNLPDGYRLLDTFQDAKITVSNNLIRIFPANSAFEPIFLRLTSGNVTYAGSAPNGAWQYHAQSNTWLAWHGKTVQPKSTSWLEFLKLSNEPVPPQLLILEPDEVQADTIPDLHPPFSGTGNKIFYYPSIVSLDGVTPAIIGHSQGLATLKDTSFSLQEKLSYDVIGKLPKVWSSGRFNLIQSEKGVFFLNEDMTIERIENFPIEQPWQHQTSINYIEYWKAYMIVDRSSGKIFISTDMREFSELNTEKRITKFVGVLPSPLSVLTVGEDRLYTVTTECAQ